MKSSPERNKRCNQTSIESAVSFESVMERGEIPGVIFNIQRFSVHDGPGIRTTVFMKGCPLRCHWCSNAESINPQPELGVIRDSCNNCEKCLGACPKEAISFDDNRVIQFNRERCNACGECVAVCSPGALAIYGKQVSVDDVFKEIVRDKSFYGSDGGVTVSGGEPLRQADFVTALFQRCREAGIGTCLDTCGCAATDELKKVLTLTDYVLYDIKHMDAECHRRFTGVNNDLILSNARVVAASGSRMLYRVPLIAGVNDTAQNIEDTALFVKTLGGGAGVELLPYHRLGVGKYKTLDKPYPGENLTTPSLEQVNSLKRIFEEFGVPCTACE